MLVKSGDELKSYIAKLQAKAMEHTKLDRVYERDFVDYIRRYCFGDDFPMVHIICGFRATGKTFGLLQAVSDCDDTIYIQAQLEENMNGRDYISFLKTVKEKNIIIDEYTWIKDNHDLSGFLWTLAENGKRIAITGTHSLALEYLKSGELIHRCHPINVNLFTYEEFCRIYQKEYSKASCLEFLKTGGIFKEYAIENFKDMQKYLQEAVIDDLSRFMNLDEQEAKAIVYDIMYLAVNNKHVSAFVGDSTEKKIHYPQMRQENPEYRKMLTNFGIDPTVEITPFKFKIVSDVLEQAKFIVKTHNVANQDEYRLHLVNPSLTYQMVSAVFDDVTAEEQLGKAFESYAVTFMYYNTKSEDYMWYADLGQRLGKPELEIVIVNPNDHLVYLFDAKLQEAASLSENSSLVSKGIEALFSGADIGGRYVICNTKTEKCGVRNGKKVIFTRIDCETLQNYRDFDDVYNKLQGVGNGDDEQSHSANHRA